MLFEEFLIPKKEKHLRLLILCVPIQGFPGHSII